MNGEIQMGLFDVFKKKECSICGGEIGMMSNRKLQDGNMCKNCEKKLSYWFGGRRQATVSQIHEQLAYREENRKKVIAFNTTRMLGEKTKIQLDEDAQLFLVSLPGDPLVANPDVLAFSDIIGCDLDISHSRTEDTTTDKDGNRISYNPPRFTYRYDFYVVIRVRHPYFNAMRVQLNSRSVAIEDVGGRTNLSAHPSYCHYKQMGEEIKQILLKLRQDARTQAAAANEPGRAVTCPHCRATTIADASGRCEFCGGAVN